MLRVFPATLALVLFCTANVLAVSTPTSIGSAGNETSGTSLSFTVTAAVSAGNTILVTIALDPVGGTVSVSDSKGNSYTSDAGATNGSGTSGVRTLVFSAPVTTALTTSDTITLTLGTATSAKAIVAYQVSGLVSASRVDQIATATASGSSVSVGPTAGTSQASELVFVPVGYEYDTSATFTPESSPIAYTALSAVESGSGGSDKTVHVTIAAEYKIISATGTQTATATLAKSANWGAAIVTYKSAPGVTSVSSTAANAAYTVGAVIPITVTFAAAATVTGTPQLALNSGATVNYGSGSGTTTLTFNYTVASGQTSSDLDESSATALTLNGGTIKDSSGNFMDLALPNPGASGSLGSNKSIIIDTTTPTITIGAPSATVTASGPVTYTVTYSDANFSSSTLAASNITLNTTGNANATIGVSGSGTTRTVTLSSITGDGTLGISISAGTATDTAGNSAAAAGPSTTFQVDSTAPITASVTAPTNGSIFRAATVPATLSGNAADNSGGAGLNANSTTFTLQRGSDNFYWSGSTWQSGVANLATTHSATTSSTSASWSDNATLPTWSSQSAGTYKVQAKATDKVGNTFTGTASSFVLGNTLAATSIVTASSTSSGTSITTGALTTGVAVNNTVIVTIAMNTSSSATVSVTDTKGNTYAKDADISNSTTVRTLVFSAPVTTALTTSDTITVSFNGTSITAKAVAAFYVNGLVSASRVDQTHPATGSSTAVNSGNATTTLPDEVLIGALGIANSGTLSSFPSGFATATAKTAASTTLEIQPIYSVVSATGTYAASATAGSSGAWAAAIVTYKIIVPTVSSITLANSSPTATNSVSFNVTFSETVFGVDTNDFTLTASGVSGASITSVSGSGSAYTVTVNTGTGSGTIRLDVTDHDSIADSNAELLGGTGTSGAGNGSFTTGSTYTIDRTTSSSVTSSSSANTSTYGDQVTFTNIVTANAAGDGTPSGTITFKDGTNTLGTATLGGSGTSATATFTTTASQLSAATHSITAVYAGDSTYSGSTSSALSQTVNKKALSATAPTIASKVYDATTTAGAVTVGTLSGFVGSETVTATATAANYSSANVGSYSSSITYTLHDGSNGGYATNYSLANGTATGQITQKPLSVTVPTIAPKVYDATTTAGAVTVGTLSGFVGSETVSATATAATYSSANVGSYSSTVNYTLHDGANGGLAANYSLASGPATGQITQKALSVTAPAIASKVYDATTTAGAVTVGTLSGFVGSETVTATATAANYSSANVGSYSSTVTYTLHDGSNGGLAANYSLASGTATGQVTAKALTMSGLSVPSSKVYDATTTATVSGTAALQSAESAGSGTTSDGKPYSGDTVSITGTASGIYNSKDVGTASSVSFNGLSLTGAQSGDYSLTMQSAASATITAKALTMSGLSVPSSKVYNATITATVSGTAALQSAESAGSGTTSDGKPYLGDTVSITGTASGTYNSKDVATASSVSFSGLSLTGAQSGDYSLTTQSAASATITSKSLTVSGLIASNKVYNATTTATIGGTAVLQSAEAPGSGTTSDGKPYTGDAVSAGGTPVGTFASANVGTGIAVTVAGSTLTGAQATDYSIIQQTGLAADITKASTLNTVISSSNPALPSVSVSFTNVLTAIAPGAGTPTGTVQFLTNGFAAGGVVALSGGAAFFSTASLPHGSNSITAQYAGDGNFFGSTNSLSPEQVINRPPVPGTNTLGTAENMAASVSLVKFLTKASDPDGDAMSILSVNATSAQGGSLALSSTNITYTPPANYEGADAFTYTLADSFGGTSNATVYVTVRGPNVSMVISNITQLPDGNYQIKSSGIPGNSYLLQASSDLSAWSNILINSADVYGVITFTDLTATNYSSRFYRTAAP